MTCLSLLSERHKRIAGTLYSFFTVLRWGKPQIILDGSVAEAEFDDPSADWIQLVGQEGGDLRELTKAVNTAFAGRGGGKPFFTQGTLHGEVGAVTRFLKEQLPGITIA